jgi:hypothetical protein
MTAGHARRLSQDDARISVKLERSVQMKSLSFVDIDIVMESLINRLEEAQKNRNT